MATKTQGAWKINPQGSPTVGQIVSVLGGDERGTFLTAARIVKTREAGTFVTLRYPDGTVSERRHISDYIEPVVSHFHPVEDCTFVGPIGDAIRAEGGYWHTHLGGWIGHEHGPADRVTCSPLCGFSPGHVGDCEVAR